MTSFRSNRLFAYTRVFTVFHDVSFSSTEIFFSDITYDRICEKEPIGRELFTEFCGRDQKLKLLVAFVKAVVSIYLSILRFKFLGMQYLASQFLFTLHNDFVDCRMSCQAAFSHSHS